MRILVTGATGFVGTQLCSTLVGHGYEVFGAVRSSNAAVVPGVRRISIGSIENFDGWSQLLLGIDAVVHLAARVHVMRETKSDPERQFFETNAVATERLALHAARSGVRHFIFLSSVKVNGEQTGLEPFRAEDKPAPVDGYGRSKLAGERSIERVHVEAGLQYTIIRPPLVYGPRVGGNMLRLMQLINRGIPLPFGGIRNARSLVSVWTLCDLVRSCLESVGSNAATNRVLMVSDGQDLSTAEIVRHLANGIGTPPRLLSVPTPVLRIAGRLSGRAGEVERLIGSLRVDDSVTRRLLRWSPPLHASTALARTGAWFSACGDRTRHCEGEGC